MSIFGVLIVCGCCVQCCVWLVWFDLLLEVLVLDLTFCCILMLVGLIADCLGFGAVWLSLLLLFWALVLTCLGLLLFWIGCGILVYR